MSKTDDKTGDDKKKDEKADVEQKIERQKSEESVVIEIPLSKSEKSVARGRNQQGQGFKILTPD